MSQFGIMNHLEIHVCKDADEAVEKGHIYRGPIKPVEIDKVVVNFKLGPLKVTPRLIWFSRTRKGTNMLSWLRDVCLNPFHVANMREILFVILIVILLVGTIWMNVQVWGRVPF